MKPLFAHLTIPAQTSALLWDMDGVLLNSLQHDIDICAPLLSRYLGRPVHFSTEYIKSIFALDPIKFIDVLLAHCNADVSATTRSEILDEYLHGRRNTPFPLLPGVKEVLEHATRIRLHQAVVSNNATQDLHSILAHSNIAEHFQVVVGNDMSHDGKAIAKKPAPDMYEHGARMLDVDITTCVVFEDSILGCQAGLRAGAHVIGLLTGSADLPALQGVSPHQIYPTLLEQRAA